jgi:hypothetical protein
MGRAEVLFGALRTRASLSAEQQIEAARVEVLAEALGISQSELPALIAQLQARTPPAIELVWGGGLRVLSQPSPAVGRGTTIYAQGATFGHGAALAGGNARGGAVTTGSDTNNAIGLLTNTIVELAALRPTLQGEAAKAAAQTEQVLRNRPEPNASTEAKRNWAQQAGSWLSTLLKAAPEAKALVEIGEEAIKLLS